jgi:PAS domain S-box-containing protein
MIDKKYNNYKKIIILFLLLFCVWLIYHFHYELQQKTVFTHLFYIPVILSSIWWEGKGLVIALFLGGILLISHIFLPSDVALGDDILRALMLLTVSGVMYYLTRQIQQAVHVTVKNEKRYRTLFESIGEGVAVYKVINDGQDYIFSDVNTAVERIEKIKKEGLIGKSVCEVFESINSFGLFDVFQRVWRSGVPEALPISFYKDNRISGWRHNQVYKLSEDEIVCVYRDETSKRQAEENVIKLEAIVQSSNDAIVGLTVDGMVQTWNKGAEDIYGYTAEEIFGKHISILHPPERFAEFSMLMDKILQEQRINRYETIRIRKDGKKINVSLTLSPVKNVLGKIIGASVISRDITEKIKLESQLQQAQKQQAIGTLAAGIAHDFNNILFPIIGYTEMTLDEMPENSTGQQNLTEVLKAANRARELVQHILTFSRESKRERSPLQIQMIVKEVLKLMRATLPTTIEIHQHIQDAGMILADPSQVHQIVMNLCTNAYHAMEEKGGVLQVGLASVEIGDQDDININPGKYVRLMVSDTGHGMDNDIIAKIFDPYFTTKEVGKGTGLGLSVVHGIVKDYGGDIRVYSAPGRGTTFYVYFPKTRDEFKTTENPQEIRPMTGKERILVVDDEDQIVLMVKQMLESLGYQITGVTSSLKALELFTRYPDGYDLVITDQTMPHMVGSKMAKQMMEIRPGIPIILCSGFSEAVTANNVKEIGIRKFIMKPIIKYEMAKVIRDILDNC